MNNRSSILIIPAAQYQIELIKTAKALSLDVITADNIPDNPGHRLADKSYHVSITDKEEILKIAKHERVIGIVAACSDAAVPTAAYVAHHLHLTGPPWPQSHIFISKIDFRNYLKSHGFPTPRFFCLHPQVGLPPDIDGKTTWVVKPNKSSGSKGIFVSASPIDLDFHISRAPLYGLDDEVILEEYIQGSQHTCEGIVQDGSIVFFCISDRKTVALPYTTTTGHHLPSHLSIDSQTKFIDQLKVILNHLRVKDAIFDCDFVFDGQQIYILEISPRMGGNSISRLLKFSYDFDLNQYAIRLAIGEKNQVVPNKAPQPTAIRILGVLNSGILQYNLKALDALNASPSISYLELDREYGSDACAFTHGRHRVGEAIFSADSRECLDQLVESSLKDLCLSTIPHP